MLKDRILPPRVSRREAAPLRREAAPLRREAAPLRREAAPLRREAAPLRRGGRYPISQVANVR